MDDLLNEGVVVNSVDLDGRTTLHIAACNRLFEFTFNAISLLLLRVGAGIFPRQMRGHRSRYLCRQ